MAASASAESGSAAAAAAAASSTGKKESSPAPTRAGSSNLDTVLLKELHDMKIRKEKSDHSSCSDDNKEVLEAIVMDGNNSTEPGHIIANMIVGHNGEPKQTISYAAERVVGTGSFGVVFQAKCIETGEMVASKKVLQDKRYKNRELQIMRLLDHPNIVQLKHCFLSTTGKDELYLNLALEYIAEAVHQIAKNYNHMNQDMPIVYVKLCTYQICQALAYIHGSIGVHHWDIQLQNLLVNPHTHQLKLCDFGSAKVVVLLQNSLCGCHQKLSVSTLKLQMKVVIKVVNIVINIM